MAEKYHKRLKMSGYTLRVEDEKKNRNENKIVFSITHRFIHEWQQY
jgi:hypothetical protein